MDSRAEGGLLWQVVIKFVDELEVDRRLLAIIWRVEGQRRILALVDEVGDVFVIEHPLW